MMRKRYCTSVEVNTTVTVDLEEPPQHMVERIYFKRKAGEDCTKDVDDLIYRVIGRIG